MLPKLCFLILLIGVSNAIAQNYNRQDSLRGTITPERAWWDLQHYNLDVVVDIPNKSFKGSNKITYKVLEKKNIMQLDLQKPMRITQVLQNGEKLVVQVDGTANFIQLKDKQQVGKTYELTVFWEGKPRIAKNPPWDGGVTWKTDKNGNPFIATANQGIGASVWWPNKDHPYDEPDQGLIIRVTTPKDLVNVSNGRLVKVDSTANTKSWQWEVTNPINNYGVNINIGDYVHFGETYNGENGELDLDYYVLSYNLDKAKVQFKQAPLMMEAFEHWFGPYPFYEDSFKLVEVPYLGMEHQSSVTYGNNYGNGYLGRDLSQTGWGLKFDFIIIHEAGHEWFANNITNSDVADMWIHEGFTAYSEGLYLDYHFGKQAAADYTLGTRKMVLNDLPVIGDYKVNKRGSGDMYYKGANILHTLRQLVEDDALWRATLRKLNSEFKHQTVSSEQVEDFLSKELGKDLSAYFNQYLRTTKIPKLEVKIFEKEIEYRYTNIVPDFDMPVIAIINGKEQWIFPNDGWKNEQFTQTIETLEIKEDFYVNFDFTPN